jgi:para-nitrobenzyl esterase
MAITVTTSQGKLEGAEEGAVQVFKGVPFAAPPVGAHRWMPPRKPAKWNGTRDARSFSAIAYQNRSEAGPFTAMNVAGLMSEDCLYLNIWTPGTHGAPRPVMVWIHGGGFIFGAGSQDIYDCTTLAERGNAVVVTVNYRLGALGFLRLVDITNGRIASTGNEGILDQIAALEWVRDNIAEFGGDPSNVTIFGESAGGMSVGTLLASPLARGLFHKAIPQSGSCNTSGSVQKANRAAEFVLKTLGASPTNPDALRALAPEALIKSALLPNGARNPELGMAYQPVVDGLLLPTPAIDLVAEGSADRVAVMAGATLEEWKLFTLLDTGLASLDRKGLAARLGRWLAPEVADSLIDTYENARGARGESTAIADLFTAIETDRVFRLPGVRLSETHSRREPQSYNYLFTWKSPAMGGVLGACHALELGFLFGTHRIPGMAPFCGSGPDADRLATEMQDAWLAFARNGDPSCESVGEWPSYTESERATMIFGAKSGAENAPLDAERGAWESVPSHVIGTL